MLYSMTELTNYIYCPDNTQSIHDIELMYYRIDVLFRDVPINQKIIGKADYLPSFK